MRRISFSFLAFAFVWCLYGVAAHPVAYAFDVPPNDGFVTDLTGKLTPQQEQDLEQKLTAYRQKTSNEIAILFVNNLGGEPIEDVALQVGRKWQVGTKENNNGILIVVSYEDRSVYIATGYGLEGAVPDIVAKGVIDTDMLPAFRDGKYYEGLAAGTDSLEKHIGGEYTADRYATQDGPGLWGVGVVFFFIFFNFFTAYLGRSKSWWLGGVMGGIFGVFITALYTWWLAIPLFIALGLIFDFIVSKNPRGPGGRGGRGGWGGGFGGGFGGFSGGSFGGGGAGGRW